MPQSETTSKDTVDAALKPPAVELRNGKAILKQKPLDLETRAVQDIARLRTLLQKSDDPLTSFPPEFLSLLANLVHESDKSTCHILAKHIRAAIAPTTEAGQDKLPLPLLEETISSIAQRFNYGIDGALAAACIWRWEVKDSSLLPSDVKDLMHARRLERQQAKDELCAIFNGLSEEERKKFFKEGRKDKKLNVKDSNKSSPTKEDPAKDVTQKDEAGQGTENDEPVPSEDGAKKSGEKQIAKKDPLKKLIAKAEKSKKEEATKKEAAAFRSFFAKPGPKEKINSVSAVASPDGPPRAKATSSDYHATFRPFVLKKDCVLAPVNRYQTNRRNASSPKVLRRDGVEVIDLDPEEEVVDGGAGADLLRDIFSRVAGSKHNAVQRPMAPRPVRDIVDELNNAEVAGDTNAVRELLKSLKDRQRYPVKLLQFAENTRPAYWGTWTKRSSSIRPRHPLAKDMVTFDYTCDSGEEWEPEEEGGEDAAMSDASEEGEGKDDDSDMDSFLADDDEVEFTSDWNATPPPLDDDPFMSRPNGMDSWPPVAPPPKATAKRKAANAKGAPSKKRKVVTLVPFCKGPSWESTIGHCSLPVFKSHRVQLFNGAPCGLDPFSYCAESLVPDSSQPMGTTNKIVKGVADADTFAVPQLPARALSESSNAVATTTGPPARKVSQTTQAAASKFPDAHLATLLQMVHEKAKPLAIITDEVFQTLKQHRVFKNSIEAKIKEVAEKSGRKWVVKEHVWDQAGLPKPSPTVIAV